MEYTHTHTNTNTNTNTHTHKHIHIHTHTHTHTHTFCGHIHTSKMIYTQILFMHHRRRINFAADSASEAQE
jgi:hypothetical protein